MASRPKKCEYLTYYNENCRSVDFATFSEVKDQVLEHLADPKCPPEVKCLFGTWFFRDLYMMYKIRGQDKTELCETLEPAIEKLKDVVSKGAYLRYHDLDALSRIALYFYFERFTGPGGDRDRFFILQMLNDVQLVKGYLLDAGIKDSELLEHFLGWIGRITVYEQKSNLLDVLLKYYPNEPRVKAVHQQMRFGGGGAGAKRDVFSDEQNVHDEEIEEEVLCAATELYEWGLENPIYDEDHPCPPNTTVRDWVEVKLRMVAKTREDKAMVKCVLDRCTIDTESFCLPETYEDPRPSFTIADIVYTAVHYLSLTENPKDSLKILLAEMYNMAELCASGYIARSITALQGQRLGTEEEDEEPICQIEMSEEKSLHAILSHKIFSGLDHVGDEVAKGMIDEEYRDRYVGYVCDVVNGVLPGILAEKGVAKLEGCVVRVMEKITDIKGWVYQGGVLIKPAMEMTTNPENRNGEEQE